MRLTIPIVDLADGDVVTGREDRDGRTYVWDPPQTISVVPVQHPTPHFEYRVTAASGKPDKLHPSAFPPGVLLHVIRGEVVPDARPKP